MRVYVEAELAEYCYLPEAVHWIAFGDPPVAYYVAEEQRDGSIGDTTVDVRRSSEALWDGECRTTPNPISRRHFEAHGAEADYERYVQAFGLDLEEARARLRHREELTATLAKYEVKDSDREKDIAVAKRDIAEAEWLVGALEWTVGILDLARSRLFEQLREGKLTAEGLVLPEPTDDEIQAEPGRLSTIDPIEWTYRRCNWEESVLQSSRQEYRAVQVPVAKLLELFPRPLEGGDAVQGTVYGDTLIVGEGAVLAAPGRIRGRPRKGDGLIETAVQNEFTRRLASGALPAKADAVYAEVEEWTRATFGEPVSRSTAQRYLRPVLDRRPKSPSKN